MADNDKVIQFIYDSLRDLKGVPVAIAEMQGQLQSDGEQLQEIKVHLATLNGTVAEQGRELATQKRALHEHVQQYTAGQAAQRSRREVLKELFMPMAGEIVRVVVWLFLAWVVLQVAPQVVAMVRP